MRRISKFLHSAFHTKNAKHESDIHKTFLDILDFFDILDILFRRGTLLS